jgi:hypothetical protein
MGYRELEIITPESIITEEDEKLWENLLLWKNCMKLE